MTNRKLADYGYHQLEAGYLDNQKNYRVCDNQTRWGQSKTSCHKLADCGTSQPGED